MLEVLLEEAAESAEFQQQISERLPLKHTPTKKSDRRLISLSDRSSFDKLCLIFNSVSAPTLLNVVLQLFLESRAVREAIANRLGRTVLGLENR